ncbi:rhodanese-like domain-containing protein [Yoonia sp. BS5-3]|uniref:Rhodanese-like domain-containing protein n=1 Tax=Yoonia phaeophyticola TaxID=3137369 RepID=A0ABZ2V919_9RHOB
MMLPRRSFLALGGTATVGVGGYAVFRFSFARAETAAILTPPEALIAATAGDILLVDIRRPDEWQQTGIAAPAHPIDMRDDDFLDQLRTLRTATTQPIAVICARGVRSARLTRRLEEAQLGPIIDIPEGMLGSVAGPGWLERGLPTRKVD